MEKNEVVEYKIIEKDVLEHAPIVYKLIQQYYWRLIDIGVATGDEKYTDQVIANNAEETGVLPGKEVQYTDSLLLMDMFRIHVIFHLAISNIVKINLSWEAFQYLRKITEQAYYQASGEPMGLDSTMLKAFGVDPAILPKSYLSASMRVDEFNQAVQIISESFIELKTYLDGFNDFDEYFEYVKEHAEKIAKVCNDKGFYGTHEIIRFTNLGIAFIMRLTALDVLYKVEGVVAPFEIPTDKLGEMVRSLVVNTYGEPPQQTDPEMGSAGSEEEEDDEEDE